jgi:hypothetical protein
MFGRVRCGDKRELDTLASSVIDPPRPTTAFDPAVQLPHLRALCGVIDELVERPAVALRTPAPAISGWTAEQQIAHVALANELVVRNLRSLARGSGALVVPGGEPIPAAIPMLVAGRIPRGRAQSPRMVRPPAEFDRELLLRWIADDRREIESLDPASIVANGLCVPHQLLGPLDAPRWLRFAVVHTRHHLEIAFDVLRAIDAGAAQPELPLI